MRIAGASLFFYCVIALGAPLGLGAEPVGPAGLEARLIADAFLRAYDRQETRGGAEYLIKSFGRASYKRLLDHWVAASAKGSDTAQPPALDPSYDGLMATLRREAPELENDFVRAAMSLSALAIANFELYREAARRSGAVRSGALDQVLLDAQMALPVYAERFEAFVAEERSAKATIRAALKDPRVRPKASFYRFVFERVDEMRERSIARQRELRAGGPALARGD